MKLFLGIAKKGFEILIKFVRATSVLILCTLVTLATLCDLISNMERISNETVISPSSRFYILSVDENIYDDSGYTYDFEKVIYERVYLSFFRVKKTYCEEQYQPPGIYYRIDVENRKITCVYSTGEEKVKNF